ncbi:MAG TPA: hypothetical protein VMY42_07750 [Thermoguttaceae bacterium]|nr:hypothetical protein [Thermoguttaceae bacterium]
MYGKQIPWLLAFCLVLTIVGPATVDAELPWADLFSLSRVESDPDKPYPLTEQNGPWMIVATTFSGEGAEQQARELVLELRKRYKLEAYTQRKRFEFGSTYGRGMDPTGAPIRMRHRINDLDEIAVMVGNFYGNDDPNAQQTLRKLKYSHPECLQIHEGKTTNQTLAGWRQIQKYVLARGNEKREKGPMGHAFLTPNPLISDELAAPKGLDPFVVKMNEDVTHSLLNCPGKYTVQVATFKGNVYIKPEAIREIESGKPAESRLAEAAMKAHELTEALRLKGWEAYEFHDRYASIVTVGSFQSIGSPRGDGRIEINPQVHAIMRTFGAEAAALPGQEGGFTAVKSVVGIPLDVQPIPVYVPKRSISREMAGGLF